MAINLAAAVGTGATSLIKSGGKAATGAVKSGAISPMGAWEGFSTLRNETAQGRSLGASLIKGGINYALYANMGGVMIAGQAANTAVQGARAAVNFRDRRGQELALGNRPDMVGGGFNDTSQAQTMRQAAVQQIQSNKLNARSALGGEARIFSSRQYNQYTRPYT